MFQEWMLQEAAKAQLLLDEKRKGSMLDVPLSKKIWAEEHHESLWGFWKMAEFFPAISPSQGLRNREWSARFEIGRGTPRKIRPGELIHKSVLERLREKEVVLPAGRKGRYDPRSLCAKYKEGVRNMREPLPELL